MSILHFTPVVVLFPILAAGVSDAEPIYIDIPDIAIEGTHDIDLNMDGIVDFRLDYLNGEDHFAWVRLDVSWKSKAVLKDWTYESNPGVALITGASIPTPTNPSTWGQIKGRYGN